MRKGQEKSETLSRAPHLGAQSWRCSWTRPSSGPGAFWTPAPGTRRAPGRPQTRSRPPGQISSPASPPTASAWATGNSWCSCRRIGPSSCWRGRRGARPPAGRRPSAGRSTSPPAGRRCAAAGTRRRRGWHSDPPGPPWRGKGWWWRWWPKTNLKEIHTTSHWEAIEGTLDRDVWMCLDDSWSLSFISYTSYELKEEVREVDAGCVLTKHTWWPRPYLGLTAGWLKQPFDLHFKHIQLFYVS